MLVAVAVGVEATGVLVGVPGPGAAYATPTEATELACRAWRYSSPTVLS